MQDADELDNCPRCDIVASVEGRVSFDLTADDYYRIHCAQCGAGTSTVSSYKEACYRWKSMILEYEDLHDLERKEPEVKENYDEGWTIS